MGLRRAILLGVGLLLCAAVPAFGVPNRSGDLLVTFSGDLFPTELPRQRLAPVAVRVAGDVRSASGDPSRIQQLRSITVAINRQGRLFDRGLPVCDVDSIEAALQPGARAACGDAIVGSGHVRVQVRFGEQAPFIVKAKLLAFNGPRRGAQKLIYAQAYSRKPPGSFILTFRVTHRRGRFGTVLSTALPKDARSWAFLTHFDMTLHRVYSYRGKKHSYVSASCRAPAGFHTAVFPFAEALYGFADGQSVVTSVAEICRTA